MEEAHEVYNFKDETGKRGFGGNAVVRKRLADISNLPKQSKAANREAKRQQTFTKDYVEKLQKEKDALAGSLADRDGIIELSSVKLEKMQVTLQNLQQQNLQLAQANGKMLAELNLGKDRLRMLQHELGCSKGVLRAREMELESKAKSEICYKNEEAIVNINEVVELSQEDKDNVLEPYPDIQVQVEEKSDNKRICSRRNSASFKSNELESYGDMSETAEDKLPKGTNKTKTAAINFQAGEKYGEFHISKQIEQSGCQGSSSDKQIQAKGKNDDKRIWSKRHTAKLKTKTLGPLEDSVEMDNSQLPVSALPVERPSRQAARKVQSYKEIPLNVKMRRPD